MTDLASLSTYQGLDSAFAPELGLVSIVLTTLNAARFLRESIDSCLGQTYSHFELIVVDGNSTDATPDIVAAYSDPRIQLIHQANNAGKLPGALNLGLSHVRGQYLTWMQADSIYHPRAIEIMVSHLAAHPEIGQVYADFWQIDEAGTVQKIIKPREREEFLTAKGDPAGVCFLIRRQVRETVGIHDVTTYPTHDSDYRWRIAMHFPSLHIHQPLYYWRLHTQSLTSRHSWVGLAHNDVQVRLKLGLLAPEQVNSELAEIDIAYAFERYRERHFDKIPGLIWAGIKRNPRYIFNRGVIAIFLHSLLAINPKGKRAAR